MAARHDHSYSGIGVFERAERRGKGGRGGVEQDTLGSCHDAS